MNSSQAALNTGSQFYLCVRSVSCASSWTCAGWGSNRSPDSVHRRSEGPWLSYPKYFKLKTIWRTALWWQQTSLEQPEDLTGRSAGPLVPSLLPWWWYSDAHTPAVFLCFYNSPSLPPVLPPPPAVSRLCSLHLCPLTGRERKEVWKGRKGQLLLWFGSEISSLPLFSLQVSHEYAKPQHDLPYQPPNENTQ